MCCGALHRAELSLLDVNETNLVRFCVNHARALSGEARDLAASLLTRFRRTCVDLRFEMALEAEIAIDDGEAVQAIEEDEVLRTLVIIALELQDFALLLTI